MNELKFGHNATYISTNLIDELDFVIGGYGPPNPVFIYSLNTFLEAFILNTSFYTSIQEMTHSSILSKSMFPGGRPILEMLSKTGSFQAVGGIGNQMAKVVSIHKFDPEKPKGYQEAILEFLTHGMDTTKAREEYLYLATAEPMVDKLPYLNIGRVEDGFVATVSSHSPQLFYKELQALAKPANIQAALPFYSYRAQINDFQQMGISKNVIHNLTDTFETRTTGISQYFGFQIQTLPPLVNILLSQSSGLADLPVKMIQLRQDFTKLRNAIYHYEERLQDAVIVKEQLEAIDELNEFWTVFNKKYNGNRRLIYQFWDIVENSDYETAIDKSIKSDDLSKMLEDINAGKIIGKGAKKVFDWYKEKRILNRFRGVTDLWSLFEKTPNVKSQVATFEKVFKVKFSNDELQRINQQIKSYKIIRQDSASDEK